MVSRILGAVLRASLVAFVLAYPALVLGGPGFHGSFVILLIMLSVFGVVLSEYLVEYPGFINFRDAPPYNRLIFIVFTASSVGCTWILSDTRFSDFISRLFIPIRGPGDIFCWSVECASLPYPGSALLFAADFSFLCGFLGLLTFATVLRFTDWPLSHAFRFNIWVNMPSFDPTCCGNVVGRMERHGAINAMFGLAVLVFGPVTIHLIARFIPKFHEISAPNYVWIILFWTLVPMILFIRSLALRRIAHLLQQARDGRRASGSFYSGSGQREHRGNRRSASQSMPHH